MASAAIDTETYAEHSFDDILSADPSIYSDSCSAFESFQYPLLDLSNPEVQVAAETLSQDATDLYLSAFNNGYDSLTFDLENDDMSGALDPAWISHFGPERLPADRRPASLSTAHLEGSLPNLPAPGISVIPPPRFLDISLPADALQTALQQDLTDSSGDANCKGPSQSRFPPESVAILRKWLEEHEEDPYPTSQDKIILAASSHLTVRQVSNWFVNNRQRQPPRKRQLTPMEAWLSGSSDDEAASEADIQRAVQNPYSVALKIARTPPLDISSYARSMSAGSMSSAGSAFSQCQGAVLSGPPRRGRKRHYGMLTTPPERNGQNSYDPNKKLKTASNAENGTDERSDSVFQCTFCYKLFSSKTWKRHETTQHLPQSQWTCMKNGFKTPYDHLECQHSVQSLVKRPDSMCIFCMVVDPDDTHGASCHRISECLEKSESDRTFSRKDHLVQHLMRFHEASLGAFNLDLWKSDTGSSDHQWNCGFCGELLANWDTRANHIAKHFREGKTMKSWDSNRRLSLSECCPKTPKKDSSETESYDPEEVSTTIRKLKQQIRESTEDLEFYKRERDYFMQVIFQTPGGDLHFPRPSSPRHRRLSVSNSQPSCELEQNS